MLKIYNTLTKKKEEFKPIDKNRIGFYHCGPTVYWTQHIGNMRAMVLCDFIVRSLEYLGYNVKLVRNYTDVGHLTSDEDEGEDKLEKGAKREGKTPEEIAKKYISIFENDLKDLNIMEPEAKPRATKHIKEMQAMIKILLEKGFAYKTELAIYFDVSKVKNYTKLSGQILEKNISEASSGEASDKNKKKPADFALWFFKKGAHKNALQTWSSPWGEGFPGWHIECSAMSKKYLGNTFDLHMGGIEHVPVHHTNEIAQSESANGVKFVNYWLHNGHLTVDGSKMAKSEGTAYSVEEIKSKDFNPLALRYFFLQAHYRSNQNFTWDALVASKTALKNMQEIVLGLKASTRGSRDAKINEEYKEKFISALEDDFNIPQALAVAWEMLKSDKLVDEEKLFTIYNFDIVLGLKLDELKQEETVIPKDILALIDNRDKFRELGDFAESDRIRKEIENLGYQIEDTPKGAKISKKL